MNDTRGGSDDDAVQSSTDLSSEPISISEHVVDLKRWDEWSHSAAAADRVARRLSLIVGLGAGLASVACGLVFLNGAWAATALVYGPLAVWGVASSIRTTTRSAKLKATATEMRRALSPSELSTFDTQVLIAILMSPRATAGTHHRLITVNRGDPHVKIAVMEYEMSQVEPWNYPNGVSGGG